MNDIIFNTVCDKISISAQKLNTGETLLTFVNTSLINTDNEKYTVTQLSGQNVKELVKFLVEQL